jgi:hypothetical protein
MKKGHGAVQNRKPLEVPTFHLTPPGPTNTYGLEHRCRDHPFLVPPVKLDLDIRTWSVNRVVPIGTVHVHVLRSSRFRLQEEESFRQNALAQGNSAGASAADERRLDQFVCV